MRRWRPFWLGPPLRALARAEDGAARSSGPMRGGGVLVIPRSPTVTSVGTVGVPLRKVITGMRCGSGCLDDAGHIVPGASSWRSCMAVDSQVSTALPGQNR